MNNFIIHLFALVILVLPFAESQAQDTIPQEELIQTLAEAFIKKSQIPGLSIAIAQNEKIIYSNGFGYADIKAQKQMTKDHRMRTASVSKVITATALGRLVSQGKLDLDAPIKKYIPYLSPTYANLSSRQLAGHTSGIDHQPKGQAFKKKQYHSIKESVELLDFPLLFPPDSDYKYSTHAYNLLAAVIEGASGKKYVDFMKEEIFIPLKMKNTAPEDISVLHEKDAQLYFLKKGKLRLDKRLVNGSYKLAGAGFKSTSEDLVKMMNAYSNGFISKEVVQEMFTSRFLENGEDTRVGLGWRVSYDAFGNEVIEHAGNWQGARSAIVYYPEENLSIALMINAKCQVLIEETAHIFAHLFLDHSPTLPPTPIAQNIEIEELKSNGETEKYRGTVSINGSSGQLNGDGNGSLKSTDFYYLGFGEHYAAVSSYGLFYLKCRTVPPLGGSLFIYDSRNSNIPTKQPATYSFKAIE